MVVHFADGIASDFVLVGEFLLATSPVIQTGDDVILLLDCQTDGSFPFCSCGQNGKSRLTVKMQSHSLVAAVNRKQTWIIFRITVNICIS